MTLTDEQIEEIKARAEAATPGPWAYESVSEKSNDYAVGIICPVDDEGDPAAPISGNVKNHPHYLNTATGDFGEWWCEQVCAIDEGWHGNYGNPHDDAAFIAHARTDIPALLSALEAEKAKLFEARATIKLREEKNAELTRTAAAHMHRADEAEKFSTAARDVLAERLRQIEAEGWTPDHDDTHAEGEMALAAACYAITSAPRHSTDHHRHIAFARYWPWAANWWKPKTPRANLVRAGALILAEIERLDRAALTENSHDKG